MTEQAPKVPALSWPDLPVVDHLEELREAITRHPVVVVAGETGSGKTTQLPKLCLELGRGAERRIAHTQPRRLAARSVAARIAEELDSQPGALVGYRVRFTDQVSEQTRIKLMTDGMLLAELQQDRCLAQYDTLIIDEAHERSLNIDFLLGVVKQLLPQRPDLRVIITSATIDHERFSAHFDDAPVIEVSGRTWPVDVRYREPPGEGDFDLSREVEQVLREIRREEKGNLPSARDVLVFLSGEREIRDLHHHLRRCDFPDTEILPLYARLSRREQNRVFEPHRGRRVVLATNVAETSLTVPGIRYVIDTGTARISRYSVHSRVQRLPVEAISQASAEQRAGRAGRLMPGICYRLYSEDDFLRRPEFTDPEIRRTSLAAVILRMADAGLGRVEDFPFLDPPEGKLIRDGYRLLEELGALRGRTLTRSGRRLARLPVDPRLGRMLLAAADRGALSEVLIIVAALSVQDPRERPQEKTQQADQAHQPFTDRDSDFVFWLNLWREAEQHRADHSRNQHEKWLKKRFLSPTRMRDWRETHRQLLLQCRHMKMPLNRETAGYEAIHRSLLAGLLGQVIKRTEAGEWLSTRNRKPVIWPGSALAKTRASWLMAGELVETSRLFARTVARVEPEWIEEEGAHLVKRQYAEPHWSKRRGYVMAKEQVLLFGLPLVTGRRVHYGPKDPQLAREMLIREALVAGRMREPPDFVRENRALVAELEDVEDKLRRRGLVADEEVQLAFYSERLPDSLYTAKKLLHWYRKQATPEQRNALRMDRALLLPEEPALEQGAFPDRLEVGGMQLPLEYSFDPAGERDGVTLVVPVEVLHQVPGERLQWLVPGLLPELLETLLRGLPKSRRRHFVPVPEYVRALAERLDPACGEDLLSMLTSELQKMTGVRVEREEWEAVVLPVHLRMHVRVMEGRQVLDEGRDLTALRERHADRAGSAARAGEEEAEPEGTDWVFGELEAVRELERAGVTLRVWPALEDRRRCVARVFCTSEEEAARTHVRGTARLLALRLASDLRALEEQARRLPGFQKMAADRELDAAPLMDQVLLVALREHFDLHRRPVRDHDAFRERLAAGGETFVAEARQWLEWFSTLLEAYRGVAKRLEKDFPLAWAHAHRDLKAQLAALVFPEFPLRVPLEWLRQYPRYFHAIEHRLDRLGGQIGEDRARVAELEALWDRYRQRAGDRPLDAQPPELQTWRWMLEEYRVSLFAQHLGTRMPVSAKRLRRQWELC